MRTYPIFVSTTLCFLLIIAFSTMAQEDTHRFTILHTNDEHGSLLPHPQVDYTDNQHNQARGGFARLATMVDSIRTEKQEQNESVFLFSGGDIMGGFPHSFLVMAGQAPELHLMQEIGYDVITIGNHEFDYGPDKLADYLKATGYPEAHEKTIFMGSNTYPPEDHPLHQMDIPRNTILETESGLQIGVLGLIGRGAEQSATLTDPVDFTDPIEEGIEQASNLREAGAEVVIAVNHMGVTEDRELARKADDIDLIVGGHSHDSLYEPIIENGTPIVQAGYYTQYLGRLDLEYDRNTGELTLLNEETDMPYLHEIHTGIAPDPEIQSLADAYTDSLNQYLADWTDDRYTDIHEIIASSDFKLSRSPANTENQLGNFVTDAMRLYTSDVIGDQIDFAFQADGALRAHLYPGTTEGAEGDLMLHDIITTVGLGSGLDDRPGYPMVTAWLTGEEIRRVMEISLLLSDLFGSSYFLQASGLRMEYDHDRAIFMRIPFAGTPIPSNRGVMNLERYTGSGPQFDDQFREIPRGEDHRLYLIAADYYIASFLPLVGEIVPHLDLTLKDHNGNEIEVNDAIVKREDGRELKMWETVVGYTDSYGVAPGKLPNEYEPTGERLMAQQTFPLWIWPVIGLFALITLMTYGIRKIKRKFSKAE